MPDDAPPAPGCAEPIYVDLDATGDAFFEQLSFALIAYSGGDCVADEEQLTRAWNQLSNGLAPPPSSLSIGVGVAIATQLASNIGNDAHDCVKGTIEAPVE